MIKAGRAAMATVASAMATVICLASLMACAPTVVEDLVPPSVVGTFPTNSSRDIALNDPVGASFSEDMDSATLAVDSFLVATGGTPVPGAVSYSPGERIAIFAPATNLLPGTDYDATVTSLAKDLAGNTLPGDKKWTFTTRSSGAGPAPVRLGSAGNYVILAKTSITTVPSSSITGNVGLSPAAESYLKGFSQTKATGYSISPQVTGYIYAADMTVPTPASMTTAIADMMTAYTDAASRSVPPAQLDLGGGTVGGLTFSPGLYKWGSTVNVTADITLAGGPNDVWIFQMSGNLTVSSAVKVVLSGGARAANIFWQVAGEATLGTDSSFEGVILSMTGITLNTLATLNGRALAQSMVSLDQATVTKPYPF